LKRTISFIDVFDPANGKLVLAQSFTGRQLRMISSELIAELREDSDGISAWNILRVAIERPQPWLARRPFARPTLRRAEQRRLLSARLGDIWIRWGN